MMAVNEVISQIEYYGQSFVILDDFWIKSRFAGIDISNAITENIL